MGKRVAWWVGVLLTVVGGAAQAATHSVRTCLDHGPGTLREAVASARSGDTVDLRGLACDRIVLTRGPIVVRQRALALRGAGFNRIALRADSRSAVLRHEARGGVLTLRGLALEYGVNARDGGCVAAAGRVVLHDVHVRHCRAGGHGGGVAARDAVDIRYSALYSNRAQRDGGAVHAPGVTAMRTRFLKNRAIGDGGAVATGSGDFAFATFDRNRGRSGGAIHARVDVALRYSTVSLGVASRAGAVAAGGRVDLANSTLSGNRGDDGGGVIAAGDVAAVSSTVAYTATGPARAACVPPLHSTAGRVAITATLVAHSTCGGAPAPADVVPGTHARDSIATRAGAGGVPGVRRVADPRLGPLRMNGGRTATHALLDGSAAIDAGAGAAPLPARSDQRGPGFLRRAGVAIDVGAYERQDVATATAAVVARRAIAAEGAVLRCDRPAGAFAGIVAAAP